ncbi:hypothetical protein ABENE_22450 [Asticcacaulis benevestitus DSM 16100 = ATCC BAA-896]|uniref:Uncharacterized protein n=1 Tax=Asticcacaulis benevestitus DSM 16100 = ATCC BAA-896 TaxID=1121022 RepID=V4NZ89_9CAUL|nr:hypothetical protein ABENE_22450 [Asticcacaulis benevestitus DSM 16100 = ATCC BAA-896]
MIRVPLINLGFRFWGKSQIDIRLIHFRFGREEDV